MNRLAQSLSPYLLQHQSNPVDWYPWGDEAFAEAMNSDRPVFLSTGYAACHWCHVMAHESFEDQPIADYLNKYFVSVKVDREERPDIDQIYMNAVQVMTGSGGWPMSVFLDHDRKPFYAGTYWPPVARGGMTSFPRVLDAINNAWTNRRDEVHTHSGQITDALKQLASGVGAATDMPVPVDTVTGATDRLLGALDSAKGGFGGAPKFPHCTDLELLLSRGVTTGNQSLIDAATFTLDKMAAGGIRDHIGGGFARYSVDTMWLVPHFEKMLYDNALLAEVYVRAAQATGEIRHAEVAAETLGFVIREMQAPAGGFYCSYDADSEGVEGKFYVWTPDQIMAVLGDERGTRFCEVYDVTDGGNFEGASIPNLMHGIVSHADAFGITTAELQHVLAADLNLLRGERNQRVRPGCDDKIVTAWNALTIKSLAVAAAALDSEELLAAGLKAAGLIESAMQQSSPGRLFHAHRDGQSHIDGFADDYAFTIEAYIALYEVTADPAWVCRAIGYADVLLKYFRDPDAGGFFYTASDSEELIARNQDWHDGSLVSANASAIRGLLKLSRLCNRDDYRTAAEQALSVAATVLTEQSAACAALLSALDYYWSENRQVVIAVADVTEQRRVRSILAQTYRPNLTLGWCVGDTDQDTDPLAVLRLGKTRVDDQPTLYSCVNYACTAPVVGIDAIRSAIEDA